jgi:hypothetical protein
LGTEPEISSQPPLKNLVLKHSMIENRKVERRRYKYGRLLRDPDVKRWHENLARRRTEAVKNLIATLRR